ncbi:hypothetical protein ACFQUU_27120 [Herbaspirillum sp. GCM10030257]|uniref:hypothetical protein n=1 Tax=Herbaspirillum sp. GCM10030257 TaxID=3273393 RepID=UPI00361ADE79
MPASNKPIFAQLPKTSSCTVAAALAAMTGTSATGTVLLASGGDHGQMITRVSVIPKGANVTASCLHLFLRKAGDAVGIRRLLPYSALMAAYTYATTTENKPTVFADITESNPLRLEAGDELYAGETVANNVEFTALGASFTAAV